MLWRRISGDPAAERIVPASGVSAWLIALSALAMAALAVAALSASLAASRLAERWSADLARGATVMLTAEGTRLEDETNRALAALQTTPGILSARVLPRDEQNALLAPWLGEGVSLDLLNVPRMIVVEETGDGPDLEALSLRLRAEAPSAQYDDHARWRRPIVLVAERLMWIAGGALALIAAATAIMVTLAARAALAANTQVIQTLRLMGATDGFIARAYIRRFTLRSLIGGLIGVVLAATAFAFLPDPGAGNAFTTGLAPQGREWLWVMLVPLFVAGVTYLSTRIAAARMMSALDDI
ncbi:MAG: FtsX-like permease family protein [Pseudomonadota bacterium]